MKVNFVFDPNSVEINVDEGRNPSDKILNSKTIICDTCDIDSVEHMYKAAQDFMRTEDISKIFLLFDTDFVHCDVAYYEHSDTGILSLTRLGEEDWFYFNDNINVRKLTENKIRKYFMQYADSEYGYESITNHLRHLNDGKSRNEKMLDILEELN